jgi:hypothetical protein
MLAYLFNFDINLILMNLIIFLNIKYGFILEFEYLNVKLGKTTIMYISELLIINRENSFK